MAYESPQFRAFTEAVSDGMESEPGAQPLEYFTKTYDVLLFASVGGTTESVARVLSCDEEDITQTRDSLIKSYEVENMAAVVNQAILQGHIPIKVKQNPHVRISERDQLILGIFANGGHNADIAKKLLGETSSRRAHIKVRNAILNYNRGLFEKIGASGRTHSVRRSYELGIFTLGQEIEK